MKLNTLWCSIQILSKQWNKYRFHYYLSQPKLTWRINMTGRKRIATLCCVLFIGLLGLWGCGSPSSDSTGNTNSETELEVYATHMQTDISNETPADKSDTDTNNTTTNTDLQTELVYENSMELQYAQNFSVDYYQGGYKLLTLKDDTKYLLVPEGMEVPKGLEEDVVVLKQPLDNIYLVASASMNMFAQLDAIDSITLSGQKIEGWYIPEAKEAMESGKMVYAGKYSKPDYELILSKNCSLAIENMMISHSPEVIEKLEDFGIPVLIEYSSYESHPMGRVEWIKFFGALVGKEDVAKELFDQQLKALEQVTTDEKSGKTVAFFYITSNDMVQVRQSSDYVPKMIELAGGKYIFDNLGDSESSRSTMNMQIEEFYNGAKDADYIIYNSSIDKSVTTVDELLEKCPLLEDFKAVKEGNVWCTTNDMYQQSMSIGYLISDMHSMMMDDETAQMKYLYRLE